MTETILLTGGFGNIGSRFASYLSSADSGELRLGTRRDRKPPPWSPSARVATCDLTNIETLYRACENVTTIFHFAALNDRECAQDPKRALDVNVLGTENLARAAISCGVNHIVYMSTIHVYGSPLIGNFDESSKTDPTHPYGLTHLEAERVLGNHAGEIRSTILRTGNGFGCPMSPDVNIWHIIVNDLCVQAIRFRKLELRSPSNIQRNFITLKDICRALHFFGNVNPPQQGTVTYNVGSMRSRTLMEMAELVADRCDKNFSFRPVINELLPKSEDETRLDFDCTRMRLAGFETEELFTEEIDGILQLVEKMST